MAATQPEDALAALTSVAGSVATVQMCWAGLDLGGVERLLVPATEQINDVAEFTHSMAPDGFGAGGGAGA